MRYLIISLFIIFVIATQVILLPNLGVWGVKADLLLVVVILWGFLRGPREAVLLGVVLGFVQDIFSSSMYIYTLTKPLLGLSAGVLRENFYGEGQLLPMGFVFIGTLIGSLIEVGALYLTLGRILAAFPLIIIFQAIYNSFLTPVLWPVVSWVSGAKK